jgi:general nucleoside transport system permease protein
LDFNFESIDFERRQFMTFFLSLLDSILEMAPPLIFAALGATICEKSGIVNVGVESMMRAGALGAAMAALVMPTPLAVVVGMAAGGTCGLIHAVLSIHLKADQVVSGMALNLIMLALGNFILEAVFSSPNGTPSIVQLEKFAGHSMLTWLACVMPFLVHILLNKSVFGIHLIAVGEKPSAARAVGLSVSKIQMAAVLISAAFAGLGGACLSTATLDRFEQHMPAGLGFMAVAAMVCGRWTPLGATIAALIFAFGNALRIGLVSSFPNVTEVIPQGVLLALPYALTLLLLAFQKNKSGAPAALGLGA